MFRGLKFELAKGDALVIRGKNGAGKSTLLKTLAGLLAPTEGRIDLPPGDSRQTVGLSALDTQVYGHLTVKENLDFARQVRGGAPTATEILLQQAGLAERKDQLAAELSSGLRARVKLALAVQCAPLVLLLDEPGVSLDEHGRALVDLICFEQRERGVLLVATNDPQERRLGNLELELAG